MIFRSSPHRDLEKRIGYKFRKTAYLDMALLHPSALNEKPAGGAARQTNQRLEFLGDAVLGLLAAEMLYENHGDAAEGELTRMRSSLANTKTLAEVAARIDIGPSLVLGKGEENSGGRSRESNLADAMEAVLGAVFLDGGIKSVRAVFLKHFAGLSGAAPGPVARENPKGRLQEWTQAALKHSPEYRVVSDEGPPHARTFVVEVSAGTRVLARGQGSSKRAAEADAAARALQDLENPPADRAVDAES